MRSWLLALLVPMVDYKEHHLRRILTPDAKNVPIGGITYGNLEASVWWSRRNNRHSLRVVGPRRRNTIETNLSCPTAFLGGSSVNMKDSITAVTIDGTIDVWVPSEERKITRNEEVGLCVVGGAALGPVLAVSEGGGRVKVFNQDSDLLNTCVLDITNSMARVVEIIKGKEAYSLFAGCQDNSLRIFDIPWNVAHSRCHKNGPYMTNGPRKVIRLPTWLQGLGRIQVAAHNRVLIEDTNRATVCVMDIGTEKIVFRRDRIGGLIYSSLNNLTLSLYYKRWKESLSLK